MDNKLISVIIPVYNVEKYLDICVESVVNQTYKNLEIILVDDGSPDNCSMMCDIWAEKDNRINVIHKDNSGLSDARNAGYAVATGEYISFIDSDDYIEQDFYRLLAIELDNGADIAECATKWCDEAGNTLAIRGFSENKILDTVKATQTLLKENGIYQTVWNKLYRKSCIQDIHFPFGKYHEDNFWTWQVFLQSKKISVITKPLYNYVQRNSGIMGTGYSIKRLDALEANYICYETLKNNDNYKNIVFNKIINSCMFHMQSAMKFLNGSERKEAILTIKNYYNKVDFEGMQIDSLWGKLYTISPMLISKIRAIIGKGF